MIIVVASENYNADYPYDSLKNIFNYQCYYPLPLSMSCFVGAKQKYYNPSWNVNCTEKYSKENNVP